MDIKVLTYNIHKGFCTGNRRFVLKSIRERIQEANADVVFLQEIYGDTPFDKKWRYSVPDTPQFEFLADQIWPHYIYGKNAIYRKGDHGNAILSKYPFVEWENISLTRNPYASRSILHGIMELPGSGTRLHALCIHLGLFYRERKVQLKRLVERIESHVPHHEPLIIAGDFNDWHSRVERHLESDLEVKELFHFLEGRHKNTFPIWKPMLPVDRIYFRGVTAKSCERHCEGHWLEMSDHAALAGTFRIE